ncbi:MAG: hypothetical protein RLY95_1381, partial [Pseudomonadota bacterium]
MPLPLPPKPKAGAKLPKLTSAPKSESFPVERAKEQVIFLPATPAPALVLREAPRPTAKPQKQRTGPRRLFVLDTNVLMHDPMCLFRFEEHDVYLPMIVLEELDSHKKGMTEVARNAR